MTALCLRGWGGPLVGVVALAACRASVPGAASGGGASSPSSSSPSSLAAFVVVRYAESLPITALALGATYVWAGTAHGLRRWKVGGHAEGARVDVDAEPIGPESGLPGHRIDALGVDDEGRAWVATEAGIGRFVERAGRLRFEARGTLPAATMLLVPARTGGVAWAGGAAGLSRYDGHGWTAVDVLRDVPITSLDLDADGQSVWAGTYGRGLFLVDAQAGKATSPAGVADASEEIIGTALTAAGARLVAARAGDGGRVTLITRDGPEAYRTQPGGGVRLLRLIATGAGPVLVAAVAGVEGLYQLSPLPRGEPPGAGGFRLVATRKGSTARYQALPLALAVPPEVTVVAAASATREAVVPEVWVGSRLMGVARAEPRRPRYLSGDLTDDADRLSVACAALDRCFVVAGGAHAWLFDGALFHEIRVGESPEGRALAVVADRAGAIFATITDPPFKGVALMRYAPGPAGDLWQVVQKVPLARAGGRGVERPSVSFAAFAPGGNLWLGVGAVASDGQEQGRGAVELAPATGGAIVRHGAFPGGAASPESLPLPYDLTGVIFDGAATWFSARSGINRWQESELRHWGENEHMDSEVCLDVIKGIDGKIWVATSAGVGRFDGTEWRFTQKGDGDGDGARDGDGVQKGDAAPPTRAVVNDGAGRMWLATAKGLRVLGANEASAPKLPPGAAVVDDDMLDLTVDRFGRVWALGSAALAIVGVAAGAAGQQNTVTNTEKNAAGGTR
jgi:fructose-1,6-bisphosphatase/inositol monophosphatase family enzyme